MIAALQPLPTEKVFATLLAPDLPGLMEEETLSSDFILCIILRTY